MFRRQITLKHDSPDCLEKVCQGLIAQVFILFFTLQMKYAGLSLNVY